MMEPTASKDTVRVTIVNHAGVDIARPAEVVWRDIVETYVAGGKFAVQGYAIEPLMDDPAALLGGYRMTLRGEGGTLVDERVCRITERDDRAMRLSLCADYLAPQAMGLIVHASYQAVPTAVGSRYELHAYSTLNLARPAGDAKAELAQVVGNFERQSAEHLDGFLRGVKARLEAQGSQ